jgi:hypothetical protein
MWTRKYTVLFCSRPFSLTPSQSNPIYAELCCYHSCRQNVWLTSGSMLPKNFTKRWGTPSCQSRCGFNLFVFLKRILLHFLLWILPIVNVIFLSLSFYHKIVVSFGYLIVISSMLRLQAQHSSNSLGYKLLLLEFCFLICIVR